MGARYEVKRTGNGQWYWRLVAANNEVLCVSESYPDLETARKGVRAARRAAVTGALRSMVIIDSE